MPHDHQGHHHHGHAHGGGCSHGHHGHSHVLHGHHHHVPTDISKRFVIAAALNMAFVVAELTAGFISKSVALIGDALHNFSDVIGLLLAWGGVWLMRLAPTLRRTYGYRSASYLAALMNAALLLLATGAMMLEAVTRLFNPTGVETGTVMIVAAIGIVINFGTGMLFHAGQKSDINIRGAYLHMMADAALSAGVVVSAAIMYVSGWLWLDAAVGLVIAGFIIWSTLKLGREAMDMALAAVPSHIDPREVAASLQAHQGVIAVHDLHIWPLSTTETALTVHLVAPGRQGDDAFLQRVCAELRERFDIAHATIQVEADPKAVACTLVDHTAAA